MTKKERRNIEDCVITIRNVIYDLNADADFNDTLLPYCRKAVREIDKLLDLLKN